MIPLLCPAYLPNVEYLAWLLKQDSVAFSGETSYQKHNFNETSPKLQRSFNETSLQIKFSFT